MNKKIRNPTLDTCGGQSEKSPNQKSILKNLKYFFIQGRVNVLKKEYNKSITILIYFTLAAMTIVHTLLVHNMLQKSNDRRDTLHSDNSIRFNQIIEIFLYCFTTILLFMQALTIIMKHIVKNNCIGLSYLTVKVNQSFIIIKQFNLATSAILTVLNWQQSLHLLVLSSIMCLLHSIYFQNYIIRRDPFYASSASNQIIFRIFIISIYFGNISFLILNDRSKLEIFHLFLGIVYVVWYLAIGHKLFIHQLTNKLFIFLTVLFSTLWIIFMERLLLNSTIYSYQELCKTVIILFILSIVFYLKYGSNYNYQIKKDSSSPKDTDICLKIMLEQQTKDVSTELKIAGMLQFNKYKEITIEKDNPSKHIVYGKSLDLYIKDDKEAASNQCLILQYINDLYQNKLKESSDSSQLINYCQFLCNQLNHPFLALKNIERAKILHLNIIDKIKVSNMQYFIQEHIKSINQGLFKGKLEIEIIFEQETKIFFIQQMIKKYINTNLKIWASLKKKNIGPQLLTYILKQQFSFINQVQMKWEQLTKYFTINKKWLMIYINYIFFIQNQKLKQRQFQIVKPNKGIDQEQSSQQTIYLDQNMKQQQFLNPKILYDKDSFCFVTEQDDGELVINRVNQRFVLKTGYQADQIIGQSINILMDQQLVQIHELKMRYWLKNNLMSDETSYKIPLTAFVNKNRQSIPAFKYYKPYYEIGRGIQFVCLLKTNSSGFSNCCDQIMTYNNSKRNVFSTTNLKLQSQFLQKKKVQDMEAQDNFFIKEDCAQPIQTLPQINKFKIHSRIFTIIIILNIIALSALVQQDSLTLNNYCNQFWTFMSMYRFPIVLGTNYMRQFLRIGNLARVNAQIQTLSSSMVAASSDKLIKQTLFDQNLNPQRIFYPYYNYSFLINDKKSNIDLFYTILSSVSTLNTFPINRTGQQFQRFNSYLTPAYDHMMNTTKNRLHQTFKTIFDKSTVQQISFLIAQAILSLLFFINLFLIIRRFLAKTKSISLIFLSFHPQYIQLILKYWIGVSQRFQVFFDQYTNEIQSNIHLKGSKSVIEIKNRAQEIKQFIQIRQKPAQISKKCVQNIKLLIIIQAIIVILLIFSIQFKIMAKFSKLKQLQQDGFFFLRYFPCGPIVAMGVVQKYYALQYPAQVAFNPRRYDDVLGATFMFGYTYDYIGQLQDPSSVYYSKRKNYFFGTPCEQNPSLIATINITVQRCSTIGNGAFKQGISGFLRYVYKFGDAYLNGQNTLTAAQIDELNVGTMILSTYILDAMSSWTEQFAQQSQEVQKDSLINALGLGLVILVLHVILNERVIGLQMRQQYQFIKKMYINLTPAFILNKEKVIRQQFVNEGIIES